MGYLCCAIETWNSVSHQIPVGEYFERICILDHQWRNAHLVQTQNGSVNVSMALKNEMKINKVLQ